MVEGAACGGAAGVGRADERRGDQRAGGHFGPREAGVGEEQDREHEGGAEEAPEHEVAALQHDDGELKQAADRHQAPGHTRAAPEAEAEP